MKFLHLSDLHIGIRVNEMSMLPDQEHILAQIIDIAAVEKPDAVIIAGDIYDKTVPPAEGVALFDRFLTCLVEKGLPVFIISGNHDCAERVAFGNHLMHLAGVHISSAFSGEVENIRLTDGFGAVRIWLLPFIKPATVRRFFPETEIATYNDAVRAVCDSMSLDDNERNVLICHQFITGAVASDSEQTTVGGLDNVDATLFDRFDYVALGHIHKPQTVLRPEVRYCGTPLKYSFSEAGCDKSVTVVDLNQKGDVKITEKPLIPLHDMRQIKGRFDEIMAYDKSEDYLRVVLTDEEDIPDAVAKIRGVFPNIMRLDYDNSRTRSAAVFCAAVDAENKSPAELFGELYEMQMGAEMTDEQRKIVDDMISEIWEGE